MKPTIIALITCLAVAVTGFNLRLDWLGWAGAVGVLICGVLSMPKKRGD